MNNQIPPNEPLDEQERELARIVRALPGGEPPAALDARILKAAANATAASRRPRSRWLASAGALWGIGGAAAAVLALGVGWQIMYPAQRSSSSESAPAAVMADQAEDSAISVEFKDRAVPAFENSAPPPAVANAVPAPRARARTAAAAPAPPAPAQMPKAFAGDQLDEHVAAGAEAGASADAMVASQAMSTRQERATAAKAASAEAQARAETTTPQASLSAPAATGALSDTTALPRMKPANWLAHIRQLRDDNRTAEAKASLLEFRQRYPDFVIPSDLAPLLRE